MNSGGKPEVYSMGQYKWSWVEEGSWALEEGWRLERTGSGEVALVFPEHRRGSKGDGGDK